MLTREEDRETAAYEQFTEERDDLADLSDEEFNRVFERWYENRRYRDEIED